MIKCVYLFFNKIREIFIVLIKLGSLIFDLSDTFYYKLGSGSMLSKLDEGISAKLVKPVMSQIADGVKENGQRTWLVCGRGVPLGQPFPRHI